LTLADPIITVLRGGVDTPKNNNWAGRRCWPGSPG
jgi:hypothetical protein